MKFQKKQQRLCYHGHLLFGLMLGLLFTALGCGHNSERNLSPRISVRVPIQKRLAVLWPPTDWSAARANSAVKEAKAYQEHESDIRADLAKKMDLVSQSSKQTRTAKREIVVEQAVEQAMERAVDSNPQLIVDKQQGSAQTMAQDAAPPCITSFAELWHVRPPDKVHAIRGTEMERIYYRHYKVRREFHNWFSCSLQRRLHRGIDSGERNYFPLLEQVAGETAPEFLSHEKDELPLLRVLQSEAILESMMDANAISPAGAAGPWQFMRPTFASIVKGWSIPDAYPLVDLRFDWQMATRAAYELTKENLKHFQEANSPLACALMAYNAGVSRVKRAMSLQQRNDCRRLKYSKYMHPRYIRDETYHYSARIVLITMLRAWREAHGYSKQQLEPKRSYDYVYGTGVVRIKKLAKQVGMSVDKLMAMNRRFSLGVTVKIAGPPQQYAANSYCLEHPQYCVGPEKPWDEGVRSDAVMDFARPLETIEWRLAVPLNAKEKVEQALTTVKREDISYLKRLERAARWLQRDIQLSPTGASFYVVKPRDTVWSIARHFNMSRYKLYRLNRDLLRNNAKRSKRRWTIYAGQRLNLPPLYRLLGNG